MKRRMILIGLAPWAIICDDQGRYNFTDQYGDPMIAISKTREQAVERRDSLKAWIEAGRPKDAVRDVKWHECPEAKP